MFDDAQITVWLLEWWNARDHFRELHPGEDLAVASLAEQIRGAWPDNAVEQGLPAEPPDDDRAAVEAYYQRQRKHGEDYELVPLPMADPYSTRGMLPKTQTRLRHAVLRTVQSDSGSGDGAAAAELFTLDSHGASTEIGASSLGDLHVYIDVTDRAHGLVHVSVIRQPDPGGDVEELDALRVDTTTAAAGTPPAQRD